MNYEEFIAKINESFGGRNRFSTEGEYNYVSISWTIGGDRKSVV